MSHQQADICHTQPQVLFEETGDVVLINVFVPTSRDWERELCCLIGELKEKSPLGAPITEWHPRGWLLERWCPSPEAGPATQN